MEFRQVRYFVVVAEELHFGKAAERLMIVQSAVSQQVARLERELGVELFDRSPRRVRLTAAGRAFLPAAREVLAAERRARASVRAFAAGHGAVLRVGTSRGMGERLERVLEALEREVPGTRVELASAPPEVRLRRVAAGEWDAAFVRGELDAPEGVRQIPVWEDELLVALPARHPLARGEAVDLARLADLPLHLTERRNNPPLVDLVLAACRAAGFAPVPGPAHGSLQDTLAAVGTGAPGWTVVYAAAAHQLRSGRVVFLPVRAPSGGLRLPTVLAVRDPGSGPVRALLDACREAARGDLDS
ncbi:LysR family transcriptional regulator [Bailinhaonella thermotolerans]|uniref:LysR family transcriptional regulator n=1 Tax=Bailinhaonella thermotolerans TaxID=1070861 RepID=A0A3A4BCX0_9ACTN|nr:LysR family transcriptional regulator [Bailinhaonella thermotolerans]RJL35946.1 LysR family transcriptional regulator [Bailinhaonella thermotolerans]